MAKGLKKQPLPISHMHTQIEMAISYRKTEYTVFQLLDIQNQIIIKFDTTNPLNTPFKAENSLPHRHEFLALNIH